MASPWAQLEAWLLFPAVLLITAAGVGLLVERACRVRLPGPLVVPLGVCASIVGLMAVYKTGLTAPAGVAVLLVAAIAGIVLHRHEWRAEARRVAGGWGGLAALAVFVVYIAPAALTGDWTWTGYNFVNDTAFQLILADWIAHHGLGWAAQPRTTTSEVVRVYLQTAYPLGSQAHLATLAAIARAPLEVVYQSYLSGLVAVTSMSLFALARRAGLNGPAAAGAAFVASAAALTYNYALQGNVKEMAMLATLAAAVAIGMEIAGSERPLGLVVCLGIVLAASMSVYYAAAVPYVGVVVVLVAVAAFGQAPAAARRRLVVAAAAGALVVVVASAPALAGIRTSRQVLQGTFASSAPTGNDLAQLKRPLPPLQGAGIWLAGDYRDPVAGAAKKVGTAGGIALVLGLCLASALALRRRRELGVAVLLATGVIVYVVVSPRTSPYADAKLLALLSPGVLLAAMVGALAWGGRLRRAGVAAATLVGVLVLASVALAYHEVRLAPVDRMEDLKRIDDRFAGSTDGTLFNEFDEFGKYFLRDLRNNTPTEAITEAHIELRNPGDFSGRTFDLDDISLDYLERYQRVIVRRKPTASRPPANYRLAYRTADYDVWARTAGLTVVDTFPLNDPHDADAIPSCTDLLNWVGADKPPSFHLVAAALPEIDTIDFPLVDGLPPGWKPDPERPGQVVLGTPGSARSTLTVRGGRYQAWVEGSFGRAVRVFVDGREIGSAQGINTPKGWLRAGGVISLPPGEHTVEVERASGGLAPGNGARSSLGAFALVAPGEPKLETFALSDARQLCGRQWDWVDLVSG